MNERIKQLAEQAGVLFDTDPTYTYGASPKVLERFAELVRQDEREACAKLCEDLEDETVDTCVGWQYAEVIRGRSE
jgi:glutamyl/glutaminyl-tRNA synthetase